MIEEFYDQLAPYYHLIFPDWEASIQRQAAALDGIISAHWGDVRMSILDLACGIGTQALGLASLGHTVTASDVSPTAVERARREAHKRSLRIDFSVADIASRGHARLCFGCTKRGCQAVGKCSVPTRGFRRH
jgi:2-polyprenyl-3-methyl-5-hydroxy-6-metoxy-1,4-benzoquinol methylase